jgi:glycosyltransferase involved in cell wall biosynthesis
MENPFISICIPIWGAKGEGIDYLETNLESILNQSFTDFEVVISDHSIDDDLELYVNQWKSKLNIKYFRFSEGRGLISPNINNAIRNATGKYIKILYQDDFFFNENSLKIIVDYLLDEDNIDAKWIVTGCAATYNVTDFHKEVMPMYHPNIHLGQNTIGCPSVLTIKNDPDKLYLDETLKFLDDVEYYKRLYDKYGDPYILPSICVGIREGGVSATSLLNDEIKQKEIKLVFDKYGIKDRSWQHR